MILGAWRAKNLLVAHLQARVPPKLDALRSATGLDGAALPDVAEWHDRWVPRVHIAAWPAVTVTAIDAVNQGRMDFVDGNPKHRFSWRLRAFVWVRGEGYDETTQRVELLAVAIADALLSWPKLTEGVAVEDAPLRISVSDVERDPKLRASIAGAFVEVVVTMDETATVEPVATADTVELIVGPMQEA